LNSIKLAKYYEIARLCVNGVGNPPGLTISYAAQTNHPTNRRSQLQRRLPS